MPAPRQGVSATPFNITTDSGGNNNFAQVICPLGLTSVLLGASSYTAGTYGNVTGPPLRGLYSRGVDFQWYRITRAKIVFVSNLGSTVTGTVTLAGYSDPTDVAVVTLQSQVSGINTRTFDLASGASRELSVPIPVDSSWKKVSSVLTLPGNVYPFTGATAGSIAIVNTIGDLCCGAVSAYIQGGPANATAAGTYFLDYDVEFKGVVDGALNV